MRFIHPKGILVAALLLALPLWAENRTGVLLTTNKQEGTKEQKLEWKKIKQVQDEVMKTLQSGNKHHMKHFKQKEGLPFVMIVSCADSRVPPETVFNLQPREAFVNRAYGNVVDKVILASLEYGALHMDCRVLVVMGHTRCTAIRAAMDEFKHPRMEDQWESLNEKALYERLKPAMDEVTDSQKKTTIQTGKQFTDDELWEAVVKTNILNTMHDIRQQSPILWHLEQKDILKIVGCIYDLDTGKVDWIKE
jgi:carbonic anhydrase